MVQVKLRNRGYICRKRTREKGNRTTQIVDMDQFTGVTEGQKEAQIEAIEEDASYYVNIPNKLTVLPQQYYVRIYV